jgi:argininosuccinate lyase
MKGLPAGYNRDLQEDKEAVFECEDVVAASLDAMAAVVSGLSMKAAAAEAAASGLLLATDVADFLVARDVPFRDAHAIVGAIVRQLVAEGRDFTSLTREQWLEHSPAFGPEIFDAISAHASVAAKRTPQSTNPAAVESAMVELERWLASQ